LNNGPLPNNTLVSIFKEIVSASLSINKDVKVSFLGPRGTYSHQAASSRFGDSVLYSKQRTIADVFRSVEKKESTYGVVPFENSTHGTVTQTIDELIRTPVKVRADLYLPIHHQFLSKSSDLSEITKIYLL
jgi:chorismate mutase/prephenate dehydratase